MPRATGRLADADLVEEELPRLAGTPQLHVAQEVPDHDIAFLGHPVQHGRFAQIRCGGVAGQGSTRRAALG